MSLIGKKAPNFVANAIINGTQVVNGYSLEQFLGHKEVILFFYPKDFTFVCPTELIEIQNNLEEFKMRNVSVIACSTDSHEAHYAWLNTPINRGGISGVTYPIISDIDKTIASNYGVLGGDWQYDEDGKLNFSGTAVAYRGTFLIDKQGIVRHQSINDMPLGRNINEIIRIIDMWHHVDQYGNVCPANWVKGDESINETTESVISYLLNQKAGNKSCGCGKQCGCNHKGCCMDM